MINIKDIDIEIQSNTIKTKGLFKYNIPELEIGMLIEESIAKEIFSIVIDKINSNELKEGILKKTRLTCPIYIKMSNEKIKIYLPDPYIHFPWEEGCLPEYKTQ